MFTLLTSQGIPMLLGGDEMGRTQGGNNNAYCQDNEISWFDWEHVDHDMAAFTARPDRPAPRPPGAPPARLLPRPAHPRHRGAGRQLVHIAGDVMSDEEWSEGYAKSLMVFLNGEGIPTRAFAASRCVDDSFMLSSTPTTSRCRSRCRSPVGRRVVGRRRHRGWELGVDQVVSAGGPLTLEGRSLVLLRQLSD